MTLLIQNKKCRTSIIKKFIPDSSIHNSKYAFWIQKSIIEKNIIIIHQFVIEIRLPDSAVQKSTIYANFASRTPPHPKSNMIHFPID